MLTETNKEGAMIFCERLRQSILQKHFVQGKDEIDLTASLGFAITGGGDNITDAKELVRVADMALYEAKRAGRNCIRVTEIKCQK
jgi:diguanylate cyclase (GGDEF)-like protein